MSHVYKALDAAATASAVSGSLNTINRVNGGIVSIVGLFARRDALLGVVEAYGIDRSLMQYAGADDVLGDIKVPALESLNLIASGPDDVRAQAIIASLKEKRELGAAELIILAESLGHSVGLTIDGLGVLPSVESLTIGDDAMAFGTHSLVARDDLMHALETCRSLLSNISPISQETIGSVEGIEGATQVITQIIEDPDMNEVFGLVRAGGVITRTGETVLMDRPVATLEERGYSVETLEPLVAAVEALSTVVNKVIEQRDDYVEAFTAATESFGITDDAGPTARLTLMGDYAAVLTGVLSASADALAAAHLVMATAES